MLRLKSIFTEYDTHTTVERQQNHHLHLQWPPTLHQNQHHQHHLQSLQQCNKWMG